MPDPGAIILGDCHRQGPIMIEIGYAIGHFRLDIDVRHKE
jgi:hypothetical protein